MQLVLVSEYLYGDYGFSAQVNSKEPETGIEAGHPDTL